MKHRLLGLSLLILNLLGVSSAQAERIGYGFRLSSYDFPDVETGIYTFSFDEEKGIGDFTLQAPLKVRSVTEGAYVGDLYYFFEYEQVGFEGVVYRSGSFYSYDPEEKSFSVIKSYGEENNGPSINHLSYNYQNGTMYGLYDVAPSFYLATIDLETGDISKKSLIKFDKETAYGSGYGDSFSYANALAINYDGEAYIVSYWGGLYKLDLNNGNATFVAELDYNPEKAYMYMGNTLFFDNETGKLYYAIYTYAGKCEFLEIDKTTGHVTQINKLEDNLYGYSLPFSPCEASSPARVANLKAAAGDLGALEATLEWDNPSKTFGRGGTLNELTKVSLYRDDVLVTTFESPEIGGHMAYTDKSISERGNYMYKVVPENSIGEGDRATISIFVGVDDPLPVSDIKVTRDGGAAVVSWNPPAGTRFGGYMDSSKLTYTVRRVTDNKMVAENISETSFTDDTITEMGLFTYAVTAHCGGFDSPETLSAETIAGPAYDLDHTFGFNSEQEFKLWTCIDYDNDIMTWSYSPGYYGQLRGASIRYNYSDYAPEDYLISPEMNFKKGVNYKVTFEAAPGNANATERVRITLGQGRTAEAQQAAPVDEIDITGTRATYRANLPVLDSDGVYNLGIVCISQFKNFSLSVGNVTVSEDHEGYIKGKVTSNGKPVANAVVRTETGQFSAKTDSEGVYELKYLPEGSYNIYVSALGYYDNSATAEVKELKTTDLDLALRPLPEFSLNGNVIDVAGDAVEGAEVTVQGYNYYYTATDAQGNFTIPAIFESEQYFITIQKNKLLGYSSNLSMLKDCDLGTITLEDNIKVPGKFTLTESDDKSTLSVCWEDPDNDPVLYRNDDGTPTNAIGINDGPTTAVFGVINREPSRLTDVMFYLVGGATTHYSVQMRVFDLDENGNPTNNLLYENTYVSCTDNAWTSHKLRQPVEAPNGYFAAISCYGFLSIGLDGGADPVAYPFLEKTNCFSPDYTSGTFYYLDDQQSESMHRNMMMRTIAQPYSVADDAKVKAPKFVPARFDSDASASPAPRLDCVKVDCPMLEEDPELTKIVQNRVRYNLYRALTLEKDYPQNWVSLSKEQKGRGYLDTDWKNMDQGEYTYIVEAVYTGDKVSSPTFSDNIGNKMISNLKVLFKTDTPTNEALGTLVTITDDSGKYSYTVTADENGVADFGGVWKTSYNLSADLSGFKPVRDRIDLPTEDSYEFSFDLVEDKIQPFRLIIDGENNSRRFIWNYPDLFFDDFESHDDFAVNSPGEIGWTYIDGDDADTVGFYEIEWDNAFSKMAYMVFNSYETSVGEDFVKQYYCFYPYSGKKMLTSWAAYETPNDDWIITPKLYFDEDFTFLFNARSFDAQYVETFEVLYSTTGNNVEDFKYSLSPEGGDQVIRNYWYCYSYTVPKDAKYVAVRCTSNQKRVFMIDNIQYGIPSKVNPYRMPEYANSRKPSRAPAATGAFEVYLNGEKVGDTDNTYFDFNSLEIGHYTAGVIASYTSGKTDMSTIDFEVTTTGVNLTEAVKGGIMLKGKTLVARNAVVNAIFNNAGVSFPIRGCEGRYDLSSLDRGVYLVNYTVDECPRTMKIVVK